MMITSKMNTYAPMYINKNKLAFKGDFEDILAESRQNNSPNRMEIASRKFFGPRRTIEPTNERLKVLEEAIKDENVKLVWRKGLFKSVVETWRQILN